MAEDALNPAYYQFSNGAETIDITENLTGNGAQAVHMITRATRADGLFKTDRLEDLNKALWFVNREIARLTPPKPEPIIAYLKPPVATLPANPQYIYNVFAQDAGGPIADFQHAGFVKMDTDENVYGTSNYVKC